MKIALLPLLLVALAAPEMAARGQPASPVIHQGEVRGFVDAAIALMGERDDSR